MPKIRKAVEICEHAAELIDNDRKESYGSVRENHENIARFWNAYLESRRDVVAPLEALDILHMMALLKIARTQTGDFHSDNWMDAVGYMALAGEVADLKDPIEEIEKSTTEFGEMSGIPNPAPRHIPDRGRAHEGISKHGQGTKG
jgi:Cdc6-like AAA superfamily ATPase